MHDITQSSKRQVLRENFACNYDHILNGLTGATMMFLIFAALAIGHSLWWYAGCILFGFAVTDLDRQMHSLITRTSWMYHQLTRL